ncbi:RsmB/NOP family class I SAM-dependent RNA methyltransferase [Allosphingosinicella flava]|uniref:RsmB/NOP family class I SAM-dependent RNA methyltransferase n=1 Tax=Allosphingosinicella flava TaxID=2771430 RepID=A0A7T2LN71_9SPHN|nr:RsmB/NOP family class I SAM-dependent RNA methyltransferase [Sphingosinicella flava]QPQ56319.1 RsmB/NOP family class I SAM-dependent RNA methyltransferase [Sphingosinicella flava]
MSVKEPQGTASRRAALRLMDAVLRKGLPLEAALDTAARDVKRPDDRAFAHAIVAEALRRLADLDALIDGATKKPLPDDSKARAALRIALVQALAMDTPHHAAISTVLPLVDGGPRRLVHGVFSSVIKKGAALPEIPNLPGNVRHRWQQAWGGLVVEAASHALATPPPLDLIFKDDAALERFKHALCSGAGRSPAAPGEEAGPRPSPGNASGVEEPLSLMPRHLRLPARTRVSDLPEFEAGDWWVQDISASLPARLLGDGKGKTALDLCAAPGGKTMQLAAAGYDVTAVDASAKRLERLAENFARTKLNATTIAADVMHWQPREQVDAILLDAPCSATGIFRRHPDVLYRARPRVIAELAEAQKAMLARAAGWLKPGGTLVYSVCSLEPEEGERVVEAFREAHPDFEILPIRPDEMADGTAPSQEGYLRILPGALAEQGGADGFFMVRMRKLR